MRNGRRQRGNTRQVSEESNVNNLPPFEELVNETENTDVEPVTEEKLVTEKKQSEFSKFKKDIPIINVITSSLLEKILYFIALVYIVYYAVDAIYQIYIMLTITGLSNNILLLCYNLLIIVITLVVFFKKKNTNWIILGLIIINIYN